MSKTLSMLVAAMFILFVHPPVQASKSVMYPSEIAVLTLPEQENGQWKEISRYVTKKKGLVERIPVDQSVKNWKNLICVQFYDRSVFDKKGKKSIEDVIESIRASTISSYPGNKVTWKVLEKNKDALIYEWILHEAYEHVSPQHEVTLAILTKTGFHRIGYTQKNAELTPEERLKWINRLKDSYSIMSVDEVKHMKNGLSIVNRFRESLDLGETFNGWKSVDYVMLDNGMTMETFIPSSQKKPLITESFDVLTMPGVVGLTVGEYFESEQETLRKSLSKKIKFDVLKKTANELIYSYSYSDAGLRFTIVSRAIITDLGFYSLYYKSGLKKDLNKEEILQWKEALEAAQVRELF
ncbi:MAG: hypothetical protein K2X08_04170 [Chlamydiales bacterium]|nr:hypothetical protein [Chlamydiales bacterium]MBY0529926.1 hypothetical protein [Rhabdochlamydiaceae bacterium]